MTATTMRMMMILMMVMMTAMSASAYSMKEVEGTPMKYVSVGKSGVWAVDDDQKAYYREDTYRTDGVIGASWIEVSASPKLKMLEVGNKIVWAITNNNKLVYREGINQSNPQGNSWEFKLPSEHFKHVSISPGGHVWLIKSNNQAAVLRGNNLNLADIPEALAIKQVTVGQSGVWAVATNNTVFYRVNTFGDWNVMGRFWEVVEDDELTMVHLSSAFGNIFGVATNGKLYVREGMSYSNSAGSKWKPIRPYDMNVQMVDSYFGHFWAIKKVGNDYSVWKSQLSKRCR